MYDPSGLLITLKKNPLPVIVALLALIPITAAFTDTSTGFSNINSKYADANGNDTITFYSDGTFYIDQKTDLVGTYIETPAAYGITYTETNYGLTLKKVHGGIEVPAGHNKYEVWTKV